MHNLTQREANYIISMNGEIDQWRQKGYTIVVSPDNVLQIDIDGDNCGSNVINVCMLFDLHFISHIWTKSKSGGYHHYLKFDQKFTIEEKIRLQIEFGSDPHREYLALLRHRMGIENPIVMIEVDISKVPAWAIERLV